MIQRNVQCMRFIFRVYDDCYGPLTRYVKWRVAHALGMSETFSPAAEFKGNRKLAIPACITARAVMLVGIAYPRWRGKRSRHSRRMRTRNFTYLARGPLDGLLSQGRTPHINQYTPFFNQSRVFGSWFNSTPPSAAYMRRWIRSASVQITACRLYSAKPLSKPMLVYCQLDH